MAEPASGNVIFHVQHLLGVGHVRRASLIADAITDRGMGCNVVLGGAPVEGLSWGASIRHALPPIMAADPSFSRYLDAEGNEPEETYWTSRLMQAISLVETIRPGILMIEHYPFGRRRFRHEIRAMIEAARRINPQTKIICSVRDILVADHKSDRDRAIVSELCRNFDAILVHGDPSFIGFDETFALADEIDDLIHYTGYVAPRPIDTAHTPVEQGAVIVATGGGAVGQHLMKTALAARTDGLLADRPWRFLVGPNLGNDTARYLRTHTSPNVTVEAFRPDYPALLARACLSISQAGYNTIMDLIQARCPAVVVPFTDPDETEQRLRAGKLAEGGFVVVVDECHLSPGSLSDACADAIMKSSHTSHEKPPFTTDGARVTARLLAKMI